MDIIFLHTQFELLLCVTWVMLLICCECDGGIISWHKSIINYTYFCLLFTCYFSVLGKRVVVVLAIRRIFLGRMVVW